MVGMLVEIQQWTADEIVAFREKYGLSQEMLSEATGIALAHIKQSEIGFNGKRFAMSSRRKMQRFADTGVPMVEMEYIDPRKPVVPVRLAVLKSGVLTNAELDVARLIAEGKSNHAISLERNTTIQTVHNLVQSIVRKLGYSGDYTTHSRVMIALQYQQWSGVPS